MPLLLLAAWLLSFTSPASPACLSGSALPLAPGRCLLVAARCRFIARSLAFKSIPFLSSSLFGSCGIHSTIMAVSHCFCCVMVQAGKAGRQAGRQRIQGCWTKKGNSVSMIDNNDDGSEMDARDAPTGNPRQRPRPRRWILELEGERAHLPACIPALPEPHTCCTNSNTHTDPTP